jgi:hypothetical protein
MSTQTPLHWITWARFPTLRQFDHGANRTHAFGAQENNEGSFPVGIHGVVRSE